MLERQADRERPGPAIGAGLAERIVFAGGLWSAAAAAFLMARR